MSTSPLENPAIVAIALDGIIEALTANPRLTAARRSDRAKGTLDIVMSMAPADGGELMLAGQAVLMNEMVADAARDTQMTDAIAIRNKTRAAAVALARVFGKGIDQLMRMKGIQVRPKIKEPEQVKPVFPPPESTTPESSPEPAPIAAKPVSERPAQVRMIPPPAVSGIPQTQTRPERSASVSPSPMREFLEQSVLAEA